MASPSRQTPFHVSPVAGQKRSAPSLLPAFEPLSASPKLPRPIARLPNASPSKNRLKGLSQNYLPSATTSETYIPTSSPPRPSHTRRPGLQRTISALSERAPLATVPSIELDEHGEPTLMGRSSNSSHYQLSTNKLISRIHVRAFYIAPTATEPKKVQIECTGWNGVKVHCQGKAWDLFKGDTFTSETEDSEIMVDVQDARVLLQWPRSKEEELKVLTPTDSEGAGTPWDSENSPSRRAAAGESVRSRGSGGGGGRGGGGGGAQTSPLRHQYSPRSPVSPSPAVQAGSVGLLSGHMASNAAVSVPVQIYEDEPADEVLDGGATQPTQTTFVSSQSLHGGVKDSFATEPDSFSDNDEENDPVIHSFGPFGANLTGRMESFMSSVSPEVRRRALQPLKEESVSPQRQNQMFTSPSPKRRRLASPLEATSPAIKANVQSKASFGDGKDNSIVNFSINHLLYSQLSATPLSMLLQHVRAHLKAYPRHSGDAAATAADNGEEEYSSASLQKLLQGIPCIGTVQREGKDAAGKQLESEFYYMPERDNDPSRREVMQDMGIGGRGLRNCRKSHKQYYWRKPK
ncbi:MAG: target of SBF [Ramalina farinacea]|uniref:Target of SBF n=1 Tax=Ramalina farinacea TaxID=258253 RepID=A0AA43QIE5_9LECA|nr:target of SBF [Ramalina farinacea]